MKTTEKNIVRLAWVSFLNDLGSDVVGRLLPFFLSGVLKAPMSAVGLVEGISTATSTLVTPYFGRVSDRIGKRKRFVAGGYFLSAVAKPLLALSGSWPWVAALRFLERAGKGVRTASRDALIADSSRSDRYGKSFGLNRALDTLGALAGVVVFACWIRLHGSTDLSWGDWRWLCFASVVPTGLAVALVIFGTVEVPPRSRRDPAQAPAPLSPVLKRYLAIVALFSLANSSDAFILLRAKQLGLSLLGVLGMMGTSYLVSVSTALPAASLSDRFGRRALIASGWIVYAVTYGLLGSPLLAGSLPGFIALIGLYGLFYGFTEGVEKAWIADLAPPEARGSAYGLFGLITGLVSLPASFLFGLAWDRLGSQIPFLLSAAIALLATAALFTIRRDDRRTSDAGRTGR